MKKGIKILIVLIIVALIVLVFFIKKETTSSSLESESTPTELSSEEMIPMEYTAFSMEEFLAPALPLMIDMGSASCGPCLQMKPDLEEFYLESYGKVSVRYADIWEDPSLSGGFPAMAVPVQYFFYADGTPYEPSEEILAQIGFSLYSLRETGEHVLTGHYGMLSKEQMYMIFRDMGVDL